MLRVLVSDDRFELVGEIAEGGAGGRCVRLCGEAGGEVGFSFAERVEADAVMRVADYLRATSQLTEAAVRAAFREQTQDGMRYERRTIEESLQRTIDDVTAS